jgi:hypothetical protein
MVNSKILKFNQKFILSHINTFKTERTWSDVFGRVSFLISNWPIYFSLLLIKKQLKQAQDINMWCGFYFRVKRTQHKIDSESAAHFILFQCFFFCCCFLSFILDICLDIDDAHQRQIKILMSLFPFFFNIYFLFDCWWWKNGLLEE